jgi:hypothetical protein
MRAIERDAFTPAAGYPPGVRIAGIDLRHRVWLDRSLPASPPEPDSARMAVPRGQPVRRCSTVQSCNRRSRQARYSGCPVVSSVCRRARNAASASVRASAAARA